jgi:hypothetical protein
MTLLARLEAVPFVQVVVPVRTQTLKPSPNDFVRKTSSEKATLREASAKARDDWLACVPGALKRSFPRMNAGAPTTNCGGSHHKCGSYRECPSRSSHVGDKGRRRFCWHQRPHAEGCWREMARFTARHQSRQVFPRRKHAGLADGLGLGLARLA